MPAPPNDNFANAVDIGAYNTDIIPGHRSCTNIGATAEVGEPANLGKTVWYKFTAGFPSREHAAIYISTLFNAGVGELTQPLRTILRVFTGPDVSHLTEVDYLPQGNFTMNYAGWEFGSLVAFNVLFPGTYYIRVDGVSGHEGNFPLSWDSFYALSLGSCSGCAPSFGVGYQCKGVITIADINTPERTSFGVMPQGHYRIGYCGGVAVDYDNEQSKLWTITGFADDGPWFNFYFDSGGGPNSGFTPLANYPTEPVPGAAFASPAECEYYNRCDTAEFVHFGGSAISMDFAISGDGTSPILPYRNPTFALYQLNPVLSISAACASWVTAGSSAQSSFTIKNANDVAWDKVTVTLNATGGVSSPSAPKTNVTLNANSNNVLIFTFNSTTPNVTATLTLNSPFFPAPVTLTVFLGPVITVGANERFTGPGGCNGKSWILNIPVINTGFWIVNPTATFSLSAGIKVLDSSCNRLNSFSTVVGALGCSPNPRRFFPNLLAPVNATPAVFTVTLADAQASYGTFTQNLTIPN